MKYKFLVVTLFVVTTNAIAQDNPFEFLLAKPDVKNKCEEFSRNINDQIKILFNNDSIQRKIDAWENICGENESVLRIRILLNIYNQNNCDSLIKRYYSNYSGIFYNRVLDSKEDSADLIYKENIVYYNYIPLNGEFDNFLKDLALKLSEKEGLNKDEILICTLFSFNIEEFNSSVKQNEYKETQIVKIITEQEIDDEEPVLCNIYVGGWTPIDDPANTFGLNPQLGAGIGFEGDEFVVNIDILLRINIIDNNFEVKAEGDTIETHSDIGALIGMSFYYKLYSKKNWSINPGIGIGLDIIDTDVRKSDSDNEDDDYYSLSTINLSFGFTTFYNIQGNNKIGIGMNLHYAPYSLDKNYYTRFSTDYFTFNLIYQF